VYFVMYVRRTCIISFLARSVITPVVIATRTLLEKEPISGIVNLKCQSGDVVGFTGNPVEQLGL